MKKFDLIKVINGKQYNLNENHGIVINIMSEKLKVLFFNPHNIGNYIILDINIKDVSLKKEKLAKSIIDELSKNLDKIMNNAKADFEFIKIKKYDKVELIVEEKRYTKFNIHKGATGTVVDNATQNYIEVDFSGIDENGNYYGDCIADKICDLKVLQ